MRVSGLFRTVAEYHRRVETRNPPRMDDLIIPRQRAQAHKNQRRSAYFLKTYGIAFRHYRKRFIKQRRCCAICGTRSADPTLTTGNKCDLYVDHCHTTGKIRGLLCQQCNSGLGFFKDNTTILEAAIAYLAKAGQD